MCLFACAYTACVGLVTERDLCLYWYVFRGCKILHLNAKKSQSFSRQNKLSLTFVCKMCDGICVFNKRQKKWPRMGIKHRATPHVCLRHRAVNSETRRQTLIRLWLRVLGPSLVSHQRYAWWHITSRNYKEGGGLVKRGPDSDVSPLLSRDRWPITAYYSLFPYLQRNLFPIICTVSRASP